MMKLTSGLAAAALAAGTLACTAGTAHAGGAWPTGFSPDRVVATTSGALFVLDDSSSGAGLVRVVGDAATVVDLGEDAAPADLAVLGNTAFVVGTATTAGTEEPTLWTITSAGAVTARPLPSAADDVESVAISADGARIGVVAPGQALVLSVDTLLATASASVSGLSGGPSTFDATGAFAFTGTVPGGATSLWTMASAGGSVTPRQVALGSGADPTGIAAGSDGTAYVTTDGIDARLYAVPHTGTARSQSIDGSTGVVLSADGRTAYVTDDGEIAAYDVTALGTYDDDEHAAPTYAPDVDSLVATLSQGVLAAVEVPTGSTTPVVDRITAPGAVSGITAERDDTTADVAFTPSASTGSSVWPSAIDDLVTYTVRLHDTTRPSRPDVVTEDETDPTDVMLGYDDVELVAGDSYTITVTATNGLFSSPAAVGTLAPYVKPKKVRAIKVAPVKAGAKKLQLTLVGATAVPGTVKVYDGKKLLGSPTVKKGKVVVKLKKRLAKGKHTITAKYAGSATVLKFSRSATVNVK